MFQSLPQRLKSNFLHSENASLPWGDARRYKTSKLCFFDRIDPLKIPNSPKILRHPKGSSISSIVIFFDNAS